MAGPRVIGAIAADGDNGLILRDLRQQIGHGLAIADPAGFETRLNQIVGVVTNGLFACRGADLLLLATPDGVKSIAR